MALFSGGGADVVVSSSALVASPSSPGALRFRDLEALEGCGRLYFVVIRVCEWLSYGRGKHGRAIGERKYSCRLGF